MKKIKLLEVEYVAFRLAKEFLTWNESIPSFGSRFPNILEQCLAAPFQSFSSKQLYKGLIGKAAILFYLMVKNHPFLNSNKRIAITTLLYFLHKNNRWLEVDSQELYNFAKWVAESNSKFKDETLLAVQKFIRTYII